MTTSASWLRARVAPRLAPRAKLRRASPPARRASTDRLNAGQVKTQLEPNAPGEDTPENILRVSRGTSFEGLKAARREALEAADALETAPRLAPRAAPP